MRTPLFVLWLLALALAARLALPAAAEEKSDLRDKVLALNNVTGNKPLENKIKDLISDKEAAKKLVDAGVKVATEKDQPLNYNALFILASTAHLVKDFDNSEKLYKLCIKQAQDLQSGTKLKQAYGGIIELYEENKKTGELEKVCKEFLELKGDEELEDARMVVLATMAQSFATQGRYKEAHKLVDNWLQQKPGHFFLLELKGQIHSTAGEYTEAVAKYNEALEQLKKLEDKVTDDEQKKEIAKMGNAIHYRLSGVYVDANQVDKAADELKLLLKENPDSPTFNNDLGYIWADHDMNLDEAEKLIRKAIDKHRELRKKIKDLAPERDKDEGAYLDSLGWVLFKKKQYDEAKKWLLQAVEDKDAQHVEIYDHLGDVYLKLGDKAEALKAWKKGVDVAGKTKREQQKKVEVEKKIKDNQ